MRPLMSAILMVENTNSDSPNQRTPKIFTRHTTTHSAAVYGAACEGLSSQNVIRIYGQS